MWDRILVGNEVDFMIRLGLALVLGTAIGIERESRGKPAGISTHCFVIGGTALFTFMSLAIDPNSPARIAAQVITGVGFLGAGMILKSEHLEVGPRTGSVTQGATVIVTGAEMRMPATARVPINGFGS